ncbi:MAG: insulinase family protein [Candidatus Saccharibacteria bacterium]|nr:insulinase family protein [Pseudorhodobacter sp.]
MRLGLGLAAVAAVLAGPVLAETVSTFKLDNGMDVVVIEDHRAPVVVHMVWYRIGSADESPGHSGIAHFLEHLMFQGTKTVAPGDLSKMVAAQGGSDNAFTTVDYTAYFQRVAADRLDMMMTLESDRMRNLNLTENDVTTERKVILDERNQRTDSDPAALLTEQMSAAQYLNHPYGTPIIGWRHEIEQLSRADALEFYQANYAPNNAILVVAGDVNPQAVLAMAKAHYGQVPPSDKIKPRIRPTEPPQLSERRLVLADERVAQPYVIRTYLAPERNPGDQRKAAALRLLAELLGGNPTTSVFARALQFDTQKAVYTAAFYDGMSLDQDTFGMVIVPPPGEKLADAETAMDEVVAKFLKDGVNVQDFARIKTQVRASEIYDRDNVQGLARQYGAALAVGLTVKDVQDWPNILQSVTADEVMAAAGEVLNRNNAVTGYLTTEEAAQ